MEEYKYAGKIICECGSKYRSVRERGKNKYYCIQYQFDKKCFRNILSEEDIDYFVDRHQPKSEVRTIFAYKTYLIIKYEDGTESYSSADKIIF